MLRPFIFLFYKGINHNYTHSSINFSQFLPETVMWKRFQGEIGGKMTIVTRIWPMLETIHNKPIECPIKIQVNLPSVNEPCRLLWMPTERITTSLLMNKITVIVLRRF